MRKRFGPRRLVGLTGIVALAAIMMAVFTGSAGAIVAGGGFTTINSAVDGPGTCFNGPGVVNCNIYASKSAVWINGGPTNGANALTDGTYFFVVGVPGGEQCGIDDGNDGALLAPPTPCPDLNLSDNNDAYTNRTFTVSGGKITAYSGTHDKYWTGSQYLIRLMPYDDTTNNGGEYFLGMCRIDAGTAGYPASPAQCKYDNFKVNQTICVGSVCTPTPFGTLSGAKYYDANMNGQRDPGEVGIPNWAIDYTDGTADTLLTDSHGEFTVQLSPDSYSFAEEQATNRTGPPFNLPEWFQTGNTVDQTDDSAGAAGEGSTLNSDESYSVTVVNGGITSGLLFGNVCLGRGGGLTLGFWSNKNGQALETASDFALLTSLNLVNANGSPRDFTGTLSQNKAALSSWLLSATATNMAYMLSAQLAAMELNVAHGFVSGSALVYVGGSINAFWTVTALMTAANTELGVAPVTVAASADRTLEETYKSALDAGNNNVNFVQAGPSTCPAPTFPTG
jgi:hypothetical protein